MLVFSGTLNLDSVNAIELGLNNVTRFRIWRCDKCGNLGLTGGTGSPPFLKGWGFSTSYSYCSSCVTGEQPVNEVPEVTEVLDFTEEEDGT